MRGDFDAHESLVQFVESRPHGLRPISLGRMSGWARLRAVLRRVWG